MTDTNPQSEGPSGQGTPGRWWPSLRVLLRTRIVAGLLTVIPLWVTWEVLEFVFRMMKGFTEPIAWELASRIQSGQAPTQVPVVEGEAEALIISRVLKDMMAQNMPEHVNGSLPPAQQQQVIERIADKLTYVLRDVPSAPVESQQYLQWIVPVVAVLLTLFFLYLLGLLGASVVGRRVIALFERLFTKLPLVKTIYRSVKQIVSSIGGGVESQRLHRVVLVEVPRNGLKRIAFMTSVMTDSDTGRRLANVFIPYTPYLTTGYMQIVPLEEVSETNWTFEEAAKLIVSGGIISPPRVPYDTIHKVDSESFETVDQTPSENT